jgi:hypothetical protein
MIYERRGIDVYAILSIEEYDKLTKPLTLWQRIKAVFKLANGRT